MSKPWTGVVDGVQVTMEGKPVEQASRLTRMSEDEEDMIALYREASDGSKEAMLQALESKQESKTINPL